LPAEIGGSAFGPNLQEAALVTLAARNRVSRRGMIELARDLFGGERLDRHGRRDLSARLGRARRPARRAT